MLLGLVGTLTALVGFANCFDFEPCPDYSDTDCIRYYLARNYGCKPLDIHETIDSYKWQDYKVPLPNFNVTLKRIYTDSYGYDTASVTKLVVSRTRSQTLLQVAFKNLTIRGEEIVKFHREGNFDIEVRAGLEKYIQNISFTSIFDGLYNIDTKSQRTLTTFTMPPAENFAASTPLFDASAADFFVARVFAQMLAQPNIRAREEFDTVGEYVAYAFREGILCSSKHKPHHHQ